MTNRVKKMLSLLLGFFFHNTGIGTEMFLKVFFNCYDNCLTTSKENDWLDSHLVVSQTLQLLNAMTRYQKLVLQDNL